MPHLQSIRLEFGDDVKILAINIFEDGDPAGFMQKAGYDFTLLLDGDKVADRYGVTGTPAVFVLDSERKIRFDLRKLPRREPPETDKPASNSREAAFRAPFWAAEIRKSIDEVLDNSRAIFESGIKPAVCYWLTGHAAGASRRLRAISILPGST